MDDWLLLLSYVWILKHAQVPDRLALLQLSKWYCSSPMPIALVRTTAYSSSHCIDCMPRACCMAWRIGSGPAFFPSNPPICRPPHRRHTYSHESKYSNHLDCFRACTKERLNFSRAVWLPLDTRTGLCATMNPVSLGRNLKIGRLRVRN